MVWTLRNIVGVILLCALMSVLFALGTLELVGHIHAQKNEELVNELLSRNVVIQTAEGKGTGIIIAEDFVLTNYHLYHEGSLMLADGEEATVIKGDRVHDLLLLSTRTRCIPPIRYAPSVKLDTEIIIAGNPNNHRNMIVRGRVTGSARVGMITDAHVFLGSSGGGAYNSNGELVGVVVSIDGEAGVGYPYGIIIPSQVVLEFLKPDHP